MMLSENQKSKILHPLISPMDSRSLFVVILVLFIWSGSPALSDNTSVPNQNISTASDLVHFVDEAAVYAQHVGKDQALKEFADPNGSFTRGDVYIWAYDISGINLAHPFHPEYLGKNELSLVDSDGVHMISLMRDAALNGSGFVTYKYDNPLIGDVEPKFAYVKRIDDSWWIASGIYGDKFSIPETVPESVRDSLTSTVNAAVTYAQEVGKDKALEEFNNQTGLFTTNESYIFAFDMNGTTLAHPFYPEKIGTDESLFTDVNGVAIGGEKLMVAKNGGGFFYYVFNNPDADNTPEFKVSYIQPVDETWVIGTGRYLPDVSVDFSSEDKEKIVEQVHEAAEYLSENGKEDAISEFNNPDGTFSDPNMFVFAFDVNGTQLANPFLPGLVGQNRLNDQDPYGKYPVRQLIANAENGGGFTYYFFADPGSDYAIRLKLGYTEMAGDDMVIGSGILS